MMFMKIGAPPLRDAIRRMALAHAATMNSVGGWQFTVAEIEVGRPWRSSFQPRISPI